MSARIIAGTLLFGCWCFSFAHDFQSYFEELDVVIQQIQVNVRDRNGNHVQDLKLEDFEIKLNGKVQKIKAIEEISLEKYLEADDPDRLLPQSAKRLYVFLFDLRYTTLRGVIAAQKATKRFVLDEMLPTDLVSVFTYHPFRGMELVTNFTNEIEPLLEAVDSLGIQAARNRVQGPSGYFFSSVLDEIAGARDLAYNQATEEVQGGSDPGPPENANILGLEHLFEVASLSKKAEDRIYAREVKSFLNSFEKFADALRLVKGRKNMIWFSAGFDSRGLTGASNKELQENQALIERGEFYRVSTDQFGRGDLQHEAKELVDHLQGSGTVIFALDTSLLENGSESNPGLQSLNMIANDSGGRVFHNQNDLAMPLSDIKHMTNDYYLLSFYPEAKVKKGRVANLKVKIKQSGVKAVTTKGLILEPDFRAFSELERKIHLSEYIGKDLIVKGIPIQVGMIEVPAPNGLIRIHTNVEVRGDYFLSSDKLNYKKPRPLEVHILAVAKDAFRIFDSSYFSFTIDSQKSNPLLTKTGLKYFGDVFVKPGDYKLKVIVRDLVDGRVGSYIREIKIGKQALYGPSVMAQEKWLLLRQSESVAKKQKLGNLDFSYPYEISGRTLVPQVNALVKGDRPQSFFYLLNYRKSPTDKMTPQVAALIMQEDGEIIRIPKKALRANSDLKSDEPFLTSVVVQIDFSKLKLPKGKTYKLYTQFGFDGRAPLRSISEFILE